MTSAAYKSGDAVVRLPGASLLHGGGGILEFLLHDAAQLLQRSLLFRVVLRQYGDPVDALRHRRANLFELGFELFVDGAHISARRQFRFLRCRQKAGQFPLHLKRVRNEVQSRLIEPRKGERRGDDGDHQRRSGSRKRGWMRNQASQSTPPCPAWNFRQRWWIKSLP